MELYREYFQVVSFVLLLLNFLFGEFLKASEETRALSIIVLLVWGLYYPSISKEKK
jgi:hypothetical protein